VNTGTYISGGAHAALILWLLFGSYLGPSAPPEPPQAAEVSLISAQELAALSLPQENPDATLDVPAPVLPEIDETQTPVPSTPDAAVATDRPDAADALAIALCHAHHTRSAGKLSAALARAAS
jgi:hypothetical protein